MLVAFLGMTLVSLALMRLLEKRIERSDLLTAEVYDLKERLSKAHGEIEGHCDKICCLEEDTNSLRSEVDLKHKEIAEYKSRDDDYFNNIENVRQAFDKSLLENK